MHSKLKKCSYDIQLFVQNIFLTNYIDAFPWAMQLISKLTDFCVLPKECVTTWWMSEKRILSSECGRLYLLWHNLHV